MKEVNAEGLNFIYDKDFAYNELWGSKNILIETDVLQFVSKEDAARICRPFITRNLQNKLYVRYLFWYRETSLTALDRKIDAGLYTDEDFQHSIITYFVPKLLCFKCQHNYMGLVVIRPDYPIKWPFLRKKSIELIEMGKSINCPNCNNPFNLLTVHLF